MTVLNFISKALAAVLRLILRLIGLVLALILVLALLVFIFFWILLRLVTGRKPEVDVSAHFSRVRVFTNLGGTVFRSPGPPPVRENSDPAPRSIGPAARTVEVEDVEPRELPKDKK
jgi:hypothetical protein